MGQEVRHMGCSTWGGVGVFVQFSRKAENVPLHVMWMYMQIDIIQYLMNFGSTTPQTALQAFPQKDERKKDESRKM